MLQTVHKIDATRKASSIYCVWITKDGNPGSPLVAIWVDSAMRAMESQFDSAAEQVATEEVADDPGEFIFFTSPSA